MSISATPSARAAERCSDRDIAAIDQYCELIAGVEGETGLVGSMIRMRDVLPEATRRQLQAAGSEGRAVLALPVGAPVPKAGTDVKPLLNAADALRGSLRKHQDVVRSARKMVSTVGSLRGPLGWILLLSTLGLVGTAWVRRGR